MTEQGDQPYVDPQILGDPDMHLYEAIATLEFIGRPVTRSQIRDAISVDEPELDEMLSFLMERKLLVRAGESGGEPMFVPARRDWSAAPEQAAGPKRF